MDEPNAFISGQTTIETNIMDDVNKKKKIRPYNNMFNSKWKSDGNKHSFI